MSGRLNLKWLVPLPFRYTTKQCDKKESRHCDWKMSSEISKEGSIDTYTYISGGWPGGDILGEWGRFVPPPPLTFVALFQPRVGGGRGGRLRPP